MGQALDESASVATVDRRASDAGKGILPPGRLLSVDVLRGLCVAGMVLVNVPADWLLRYYQLGHAEWNGATATDMIFPEFLFLFGFSMMYSFVARSGRGDARQARSARRCTELDPAGSGLGVERASFVRLAQAAYFRGVAADCVLLTWRRSSGAGNQ